MTEIIRSLKNERRLVDAEVKTAEELVQPSNRNEPKLIKIRETLASSIQFRGEDTKEPIKPNLKKTDLVELTGHYSNSPHSIKKSFTCSVYQLLNYKKVRKKCFGCHDNFTCYSQENYDYCKKCEVNNNHYIPRNSKISILNF
jgi:hypothetical protein